MSANKLGENSFLNQLTWGKGGKVQYESGTDISLGNIITPVHLLIPSMVFSTKLPTVSSQ